jgi:RNAse (barnase) inhibitor barstar
VTRIDLDAQGWAVPADLWADLLPRLGTPDWLGGNLDALYDGLVAGHLGVPLPLRVHVANAAGSALEGYLARVAQVFEDARSDYGVDCALVLTPPAPSGPR